MAQPAALCEPAWHALPGRALAPCSRLPARCSHCAAACHATRSAAPPQHPGVPLAHAPAPPAESLPTRAFGSHCSAACTHCLAAYGQCDAHPCALPTAPSASAQHTPCPTRRTSACTAIPSDARGVVPAQARGTCVRPRRSNSALPMPPCSPRPLTVLRARAHVPNVVQEDLPVALCAAHPRPLPANARAPTPRTPVTTAAASLRRRVDPAARPHPGRVADVCRLPHRAQPQGLALTAVLFRVRSKVRDLSRAAVQVQPSEYGSWSEARSGERRIRCHALRTEGSHPTPVRRPDGRGQGVQEQHGAYTRATADVCPCAWQRPLKAQLTAEVAAAGSEAAANQIRVAFDKKEKALENEIDHRPLESALLPCGPPRQRPAHPPSLAAQCTWRWRCSTISCRSEQRARLWACRPTHQRTCGDRSAKNLSLSLSRRDHCTGVSG